MKIHVKFLTKLMNFTKLNILDMVEIHVKHGFRHVWEMQISCYKHTLEQLMSMVYNTIED